MRLLNAHTHSLEWYTDEQVAPPYAILSHTWGDEEILFDDIITSAWKQKQGARKVELSSAQAIRDGLDYVWIDTCCIDKNSSAELSEAMNSMFKWYACATVCYAYLTDLGHDTVALDKCRWFTRGFTLQELIAPPEVQFYDVDWHHQGSRTELASQLSDITGVDSFVFARPDDEEQSSEEAYESLLALMNRFNVATRMSWASGRSTTRTEDLAYCLMGIFDVNMPLLYGEGMKAFRRLQEEIIKQSNDATIMAFEGDPDRPSSLLASHPNQFRYSLPIIGQVKGTVPLVQMGLSPQGRPQISAHVLLCQTSDQQMFFAVFDCAFRHDFLSRPALLLYLSSTTATLSRASPHIYQLEPDQKFTRLASDVRAAPDQDLILSQTDTQWKTVTIVDRTADRFRSEPQLKQSTFNQSVRITVYNNHVRTQYGIWQSTHLVNGFHLVCRDPYEAAARRLGGLVSFREPRDGHHFFVAWSGGGSDGGLPWCKIWTADELARAMRKLESSAASDDDDATEATEVTESDIGDKTLESRYDEMFDNWGDLGHQLEPDAAVRNTTDTVTISPSSGEGDDSRSLVITVSIVAETFLGGPYLRMPISMRGQQLQLPPGGPSNTSGLATRPMRSASMLISSPNRARANSREQRQKEKESRDKEKERVKEEKDKEKERVKEEKGRVREEKERAKEEKEKEREEKKKKRDSSVHRGFPGFLSKGLRRKESDT